ncbi:MAG TPA: NUDIX hydrolase [Candidatus Paceibacterota bacterium]
MQTIQDLNKLYPDIEINQEGGADSYREGLPIVERDPVAVIIKHPSENSYLIAKWKAIAWNGFLTGGIEEGDTLEGTVRKEIHEEAGYKNVARIAPMNFATHALFFHPTKNVNRLAHYHLVVVTLADLEKDKVSEEESKIAEFVWMPYEQVAKTVTNKAMKLLWEYYLESK